MSTERSQKVSSRSSTGSRVSREEARQRILEATRRLLAVRRFRDLNINVVMQEAGLSRTIFYRYFDGLPHVVISLLQQLVDQVVAIGTAATEDRNRAHAVRAGLRQTVETFERNGPVIRGLLEAMATDAEAEDAMRPVVDRSIDAVAQSIEAGVADGTLRPVRAREVARALVLMNGYYLLDALAGDSPVDLETATETLWTVWAGTLGISGAEATDSMGRHG